MKVVTSSQINAFGGLNFIHQALHQFNIADLLDRNLPSLARQSKYSWKDIFYSFLSIYYAGGNCVEDIQTVLSHHFGKSPFFNLCSPDTVLRRFKSLAVADSFCRTPRGSVDHRFNHNAMLVDLNIQLLDKLGVFAKESIVLDYDNTIVLTEKKDSKMTYKKAYGYQPGVCFVNQEQVLFIENRNGNSDAKSYQAQTLARMFDRLDAHQVGKIDKFRADAASHQFEVIQLLEHKVKHFYIGARNSYVQSCYSKVEKWYPTTDTLGQTIWIGETMYTPFQKRKDVVEGKSYRLLVKKKKSLNKQGNLITGDAYDYRSVITNDYQIDVEQGLKFYYQRGKAEQQFDILKNEFGWKKPCFSEHCNNTVFFYLSAMCKNLYSHLIDKLSRICNRVSRKYRMKRLIFSFITMPAKWIKRSRQWQLKIYQNIELIL